MEVGRLTFRKANPQVRPPPRPTKEVGIPWLLRLSEAVSVRPPWFLVHFHALRLLFHKKLTQERFNCTQALGQSQLLPPVPEMPALCPEPAQAVGSWRSPGCVPLSLCILSGIMNRVNPAKAERGKRT